MKCNKCGFTNRESITFCEECGSGLDMTCPNCGLNVPQGRKFCGSCGNKIASASTEPPAPSMEDKMSMIQRYLPEGLAEKVLAGRDRIVGEQKTVTILFCDMVGFTSLSEKIGHERIYAVMDDILERLIRKVNEYGGTVNKLTGDGLMALFGAPVALEDAPQRAVRSSLSMHREMAKYNESVKSKGIPPMQMRIGIHTGPVVVGSMGNDLRVEFTAMGDTVNLASRIEGAAIPGSTFVSSEVFRATEHYFEYEFKGEKQLKGKELPVKLYQALAPSSIRTRFDVSAVRGLTPLVGRERELDILMDSFERMKEGRGQAVSLVAEAGLGKSRLLFEFRKAVSNEDIAILEGKCLSYGRGIPYHPIIEILRSFFYIEDKDSDPVIIEKAARALDFMGLDSSISPYILELLGVGESGFDKIMMSPEGKKQAMIDSMQRLLVSGAGIRPVILIIEDLHWIDSGSKDMVSAFLESIAGIRTMVVFTFRPEFIPEWTSRSYHTIMKLNRLSRREMDAMALSLLGSQEMEETVEKLITDKSGGVPFFIEEIVKSLKGMGLLYEKDGRYVLAEGALSASIPSTIEEIILSRTDRLPGSAREVIQAGSAVEREFSFTLIKMITGLGDKELLADLEALKSAELIFERGLYPDSVYIFSHALTRDVVYKSMLNSNRKVLHEKIAGAILEMEGDNAHEYFGVIGDHYISAENYEKGADYSRKAGRMSEKRGSLNDAIIFMEKSTQCLEKFPVTEDVEKKLLDTKTMLGLYISQMTDFTRAKKIVSSVLNFAIKYNNKRRYGQIYCIMGAYELFVKEDILEGINYLNKAIILAEDSKDYITIVLANFWSGMCYSYNCEFDIAYKFFEKGLNINLLIKKNNWGISTMKSNIGIFVYFHPGNINSSYEISRNAVEYAEKSNDLYSKVMAYVSYGCSYFGLGFLNKSIEYLNRALVMSEKINYHTWSAGARHLLGNIHYLYGKFDDSFDHFNKGVEALQIANAMPSLSNLMELGKIRAHVFNQNKNINNEILHKYVKQNKFKAYEGDISKNIAEIYLHLGEPHLLEADSWIQKAINSDSTNSMKFALASDYHVYTKILHKMGNSEKSLEYLNMAIDQFKECGSVGWVEMLEKERGLVSS